MAEATEPDNNNSSSSSSTVMDVKLFKAIGLYRLLQPSTEGGFGDRYRTWILTVLSLITGLQCMQIVRLYLTLDDLQSFMYVAMMATTVLICTFKMYVMVTNVDKLWTILDATRYGFASCGRRHPSQLRRCRDTLSVRLRMFVALSSITLIIWIITPWFMDEYVPFAKLDGTVGHYRTSIFNMWFPLSESLYNRLPVWTLVYAVEAFVCSVDVYNWLLFDCYLVTMCMVLTAQFETMSTAYETLGRRQQSPPPPSRSSGMQIESEGMEPDFYNDLILYIKDNKKIMKIFDEFIDVVRPVVLVQIIIGSFEIITLIYCTILAYIMGLSVLSAPIMKLFSAYLSFNIQLFIYCYALNRVETAKSSLNFGLYSCNWTEMDLKFKKTMLLAMNMNSAHKRVLKVSPNLIINLEMFAKVMKMSYTIVSVLLNVSSE